MMFTVIDHAGKLSMEKLCINHLLNQCDILGLFMQEHWLSEKQPYIFSPEFINAAVSGFGNGAVLTAR
jgi:hypothetical protein